MVDRSPASRAKSKSDRQAKPGLVRLYLDLAKSRLTALVLLTTAVGYLLAVEGGLHPGRFLATLVGTALAAAGANALNQWIEVRRDSLMERTRNRPVPSGRLGSRHALAAALVWALAGVLLLWLAVNPLTGALALSVQLLYVLVYTPLKPRSPLCTLAGAVCGAIPPMMGWTAATGRLGTGAWILGALLFIWQIPHFLALAWLYRRDYERGGFRMLPVVDPRGGLTSLLVVLYSLALLPVGLVATLVGVTGRVFPFLSVALGAGLLVLGLRLYRDRSETNARRVFLASVLYLPLLLGLMLADRAPSPAPSPLQERAVAPPAAEPPAVRVEPAGGAGSGAGVGAAVVGS